MSTRLPLVVADIPAARLPAVEVIPLPHPQAAVVAEPIQVAAEPTTNEQQQRGAIERPSVLNSRVARP